MYCNSILFYFQGINPLRSVPTSGLKVKNNNFTPLSVLGHWWEHCCRHVTRSFYHYPLILALNATLLPHPTMSSISTRKSWSCIKCVLNIFSRIKLHGRGVAKEFSHNHVQPRKLQR